MSTAFGSQWDITDAPSSSVDVTLGSFILLPCDPPAANPTPNVVWTRDGAVLDTGNITKYKVLASEAGGGLIIANVVAADIGPVYQCRVTNALAFMTIDSPFSHRLSRIGLCNIFHNS